MISAVRKDRPDIAFYKLAYKNNLATNFTSELYEMQPMFNEMKKKEAISHIKKCFSYAVAHNKGNSDRLARGLRRIPGHLYGQHEN